MRCRCCDNAALLPPDDLMHVHGAHVAALAHLELALAALATLPTDKNIFTALEKAKAAIASRIPQVVKNKAAAVSKNTEELAKAAYKDNGKAIAAVGNTSIGKLANRVAKSLARPAQAVSRAIKAGKDEKTVAEAAKRERAAEKAGKNEYLIGAT